MQQSNADEEWRFIPGLEGWYQASDQGRVRSIDHETRNRYGPYIRRGQILSLACPPSGGGYQTVLIGGRVRRVHQLVLLAFVGEPGPGEEVRHLNGIKTDNRLVNLRYGTKTENQLDNVRHGKHNCASKTHCKNGHEFSLENTRIVRRKGKNPYRQCIICKRKYTEMWRRGLVGGAA